MQTGGSELFPFGDYLTAQYEIFRRVFDLLSAEDLESCMNASESWKKAAMATIIRRRRIQCIWLPDEYTKPFILSDAAVSISFGSKPTQEEIPGVPRVDLQTLNVMSGEAFDFISDLGIIGTLKTPDTLFKDCPKAIVRFPPWEGANIKMVTLGPGRVSEADMEAAIDLPEDAPLQAVLLITSGKYHGNIRINVITLMVSLTRRKKNFALGGCKLVVEPDVEDAVQCLLFLGPNVEAASCVISCRTSEEVDSTVENFSKTVTQSKDGVVFVFQDFRWKSNLSNRELGEDSETWEIDAIKKFFPVTPAVGCFGVGQYGFDCPTRLYSHSHGLLWTVLLYIAFKK